MAAKAVEELARGVGALVERGDEIADPDVVVAELFFAGIRVVDAIDAVVGERRVVDVRGAEIVMTAAGLV